MFKGMLTAIMVLGLVAPALAQDDDAHELETDARIFDVEADITLASDYRARGYSNTNAKPAAQLNLAVTHESGLFANAFASNIADNGGADVEIDLGIGYKGEIGSVGFHYGMIAYLYPGASDDNYLEFQAGVSRTFGPAEIRTDIAYSPKQDSLGGRDNVYAGLGMEIPLKKFPVTFNAAVGVEDGAFGDRKIDWRAGATWSLKGFDLGLTYMDSARARGIAHSGPTVLVSLSRSF